MVYHEPVVLVYREPVEAVYREPVERLFDSAQSHFCFAKMEPKPGIEPGTSSLPWKRSTTELRRPVCTGQIMSSPAETRTGASSDRPSVEGRCQWP